MRIAVLFSLCVCAMAQDFPIVDELDLLKYLGQWKQTHASPLVYNGAYDNTTIVVHNNGNLYYPGGPSDTITGYAYQTEDPGKFILSFPSLESPQGDYWIMKLGPPVYGEAGQYAYSLVSEPSKLLLFVLARDIDDFYDNYEEEVMEFLAANGFDSSFPNNEPVPTEHSSECIYPPQPAKSFKTL